MNLLSTLKQLLQKQSNKLYSGQSITTSQRRMSLNLVSDLQTLCSLKRNQEGLETFWLQAITPMMLKHRTMTTRKNSVHIRGFGALMCLYVKFKIQFITSNYVLKCSVKFEGIFLINYLGRNQEEISKTYIIFFQSGLCCL